MKMRGENRPGVTVRTSRNNTSQAFPGVPVYVCRQRHRGGYTITVGCESLWFALPVKPIM